MALTDFVEDKAVVAGLDKGLAAEALGARVVALIKVGGLSGDGRGYSDTLAPVAVAAVVWLAKDSTGLHVDSFSPLLFCTIICMNICNAGRASSSCCLCLLGYCYCYCIVDEYTYLQVVNILSQTKQQVGGWRLDEVG